MTELPNHGYHRTRVRISSMREVQCPEQRFDFYSEPDSREYPDVSLGPSFFEELTEVLTSLAIIGLVLGVIGYCIPDKE